MTMEQRMDRLETRNKRLTATPMLLPLAMCAVLALSGLPTEIQAQVENTQHRICSRLYPRHRSQLRTPK